METLKVESTKSIDIEGFVAMDDLYLTLFDTPYYLGPDGPIAVKTYSLFVHTLAESGKVAVGKLVMWGDRETRVVIGPFGTGLILYKMRCAPASKRPKTSARWKRSPSGRRMQREKAVAEVSIQVFGGEEHAGAQAG